jgi:hypothetical protein
MHCHTHLKTVNTQILLIKCGANSIWKQGAYKHVEIFTINDDYWWALGVIFLKKSGNPPGSGQNTQVW